ncbi:hypothetical protein SAMN02745150_00329 [Brevinema andersonii]|uniref:Uncharacterized protein n=1 Tax=Brevinema andersonii TaxID=34097 RepID=A0A1I1DBF9_BREAD|nr:hypothetical protein [Brevinema andersonii]SFB70130.1 hypothetical protein SAMN02745150_00329 [Brevinema andersonii]
MLISLFSISCARQAKIPAPERAVPGPFVQFNYLSMFGKNPSYNEYFKINRSFAQTKLVKSATNITTTLIIDNDFNMLCVTRDSLTVKYTHPILFYYTNNKQAGGMRVNSKRIVVFPEFQLRDFYYSTNTELEFIQLLGEDFRAAEITARKLKKTTITQNEKPIEILPIELTINRVPPKQWRMVFYYDTYGWVILKEGFFKSKSPNYSSELITRKKETSS